MRIPSGVRLTRRFLNSDSVQIVYDFISSVGDLGFDEPDAEFSIIQPMPRKVFDQKQESLAEAGLYPRPPVLQVKELWIKLS